MYKMKDGKKIHSFYFRLLLISIVTLLSISLSGCQHNTSNVSDSMTMSKEEQQEWNYVFDFTAPVLFSDLPDFNFKVFECVYTGNKDYSYAYKITISCPELDDYSSQTIEVLSSVKWIEERRIQFIDLVDIDFDGCADIQVQTYEGNVNRGYEYYRWNYFAGKGYGEFEITPFFEIGCYQYELFPDTKQIICYARSSALSHPRTMYQLSETQNGGWLGKYLPIRYDEQLFEDDVITEQAFFMNKKVFSKSVPAKEFDFEKDTVSDNYLRFGMEHPISIEEAQNILYDQKSVASVEKTEFPLSYIFEEMCLKDELSCYKFRVQWLVDNNHWSTIGFVGVAPEGKMFYDF